MLATAYAGSVRSFADFERLLYIALAIDTSSGALKLLFVRWSSRMFCLVDRMEL